MFTQGAIEAYNCVIGGRRDVDGIKIQGLNEYFNLFNQQQTDKKKRFPKLKPLFKQILRDRASLSWLPEAFDSDSEVIDAIREFAHSSNKNVFSVDCSDDSSLKRLLLSLPEYNLNGIYLSNDAKLSEISQHLYGSWGYIQKNLEANFERNNPKKARENFESYEKRKHTYFKNVNSISIAELDGIINNNEGKTIESYFADLGEVNTDTRQTENIFSLISCSYTDMKELLEKDFNSHNSQVKLSQDKSSVMKIKAFLDAVYQLKEFVRPLLGSGDESLKDERFYGELMILWEQLDKITPLYNKVRNYLTQKPYSDVKIKLNFDNSTLLSGWDINKEADNTSIILRKQNLYYLAIMNKKSKSNHAFKSHDIPSTGDCYEKMEYKLLPGPNKMLPKVFFSKSRISEFKPSDELLNKYKMGTHVKGDNFNIDDCRNLIDFFKKSIEKHEDWSKFGFNFSDTSSYIDSLVDSGELYLFQIYNKDFSDFSKGTPNIHTLYWKMLFDENNLANTLYRLNGEAEVFYRKKSLDYSKPTHPANVPIANKNTLNEKRQSVFSYGITKDRRYTIDKFQFHVPITINFNSVGRDDINNLVIDNIRKNDEINIIGIDRGERNLLYISVINSKGEILEQRSLNEIKNDYNGLTHVVDYHNLLDKREGDMLEARRSWQNIESIKELKDGYLSQAIHVISNLIVKYNAIVVLEDLNVGFMRGRQKVDTQVYQKFEQMLIDKLNYLVDKKAPIENAGGLMHALQLTNKFTSFQKLGKHSGILFYVPAWNTSKIDPVTGFVNLFTSSEFDYESVSKSRAFFSKMDLIRYDSAKDMFEFKIDYSKFENTRAHSEGSKSVWSIYSYGSRIDTFRNPMKNSQYDNEEIDVTSALKSLFSEYDIDVKGNLKDSIIRQEDKSFFYRERKDIGTQRGLMQLFKLILQMRNSVTGTQIDYLISPVSSEDGKFYDSRSCGSSLPDNADANGAYNIARKGLWVINQIKSSDSEKPDLFITNKQWLIFAQNKQYLQE